MCIRGLRPVRNSGKSALSSPPLFLLFFETWQRLEYLLHHVTKYKTFENRLCNKWHIRILLFFPLYFQSFWALLHSVIQCYTVNAQNVFSIYEVRMHNLTIQCYTVNAVLESSPFIDSSFLFFLALGIGHTVNAVMEFSIIFVF